MKCYLLGMVILSTSIAYAQEADKVTLDKIREGRQEVNQMVESNQFINNFFANKEYQETKEEGKCIDDSNGDFGQLKICTDRIIENIKKNIKIKLKQLNKSDNILKTEYKKIKNKCIKEQDGETSSLERDFLISDCIEYDLYQFGRKLK